jgi:hypothetical protein
MSEVLAPSRLGAQWTGLARLFRGQCKAEDSAYDAALLPIVRPLKARLAHHTRLRHEQVAQAERVYRSTVPSRFRVGEIEVIRDRDAFRIAETRITPAWFHASLWNDENYKEPGCAVCKFALFIEKGRLRQTLTPIAVASLHALGRRLERGRGRDQAAMIRDLSLLAYAEERDEVETPEAEGRWIGYPVQMKGVDGWSVARAVRTWHA